MYLQFRSDPKFITQTAKSQPELSFLQAQGPTPTLPRWPFDKFPDQKTSASQEAISSRYREDRRNAALREIETIFRNTPRYRNAVNLGANYKQINELRNNFLKEPEQQAIFAKYDLVEDEKKQP